MGHSGFLGDKQRMVEDKGEMEPIDLKPHYSTSSLPSRCIKCLAEEEMNKCILKLLRDDADETNLIKRYEALFTLLKSPELKKLRDESEKYLADGKDVFVRMNFAAEKPKYELII